MEESQKFPSRRRWRWTIRIALLASDTAMLGLATALATFTRFGRLAQLQALKELGPAFTFVDLSLLISLIWIVAMWGEKLYDLSRVFWGTGEYKRVVRALSLGVVAFIVATYIVQLPGLSRAWTLLAWGYGLVFVIAGRIGVRAFVVSARRHGYLLRPALIAGFNQEAAGIIRALRANRSSGLVPVACLASSNEGNSLHNYCIDLDVPCIGTVGNVREALDRNVIDTVVIASTGYDQDMLARLINSLRDRRLTRRGSRSPYDIDIKLSSGLLDITTSRVQVHEVSGIPLITLRTVAFSPAKRFVKRTFDLVVGGFFLLAGTPLWLVIALAIKLESRGPVFYRQMRVGRGGRAFGMWKFRSMCDDADARLDYLREHNEATGPLFKMRDDPRITRVGCLLRKFSLDEFPQLINVLAGEMSLVGPRPALPREVDTYSEYHSRRLEVLPGMTGLWQVSGRSILSFDEMVRLDLFYIENWSVGFDLALLIRTVPAVLLPEGAY